MPDLPDYVLRNRGQWDAQADEWVAGGERAWRGEPYWGIWQIPEAELHLLPDDMSGMQAVELGCGTGYVSAWMARRGARVVGIDSSERQLATARRLAGEHAIEIELLHGNAEAVPKPDASFDFAISEYGAAIWADPYKWIPEAARLLRPGGRLVFLGNHPFAMLAQPFEGDDPVGRELLNPYFGMHRMDWREPGRRRGQRAAARRQRAAEPRHLRHHLDGAPGREADGRVLRQEHDRQGRVPADGRDREPLRQHDLAPLFHAPDDGCGRLDDRLQRGGDAGGHGAQVALARAPAKAGQARRPTQHDHGLQRAGRVGEVLPLLGRRAALSADGAGRYVITPEQVVNAADENTIGVVAILGTTFTGEYEPIERDPRPRWNALNAEQGWDVPLHVDAASGGFVAPFLQPELVWDFRLPLVKSINASGHKYGLVYPGVGWVVWRSHADLPEDLVFHVNYLGGDMPTFTLNFSRGGNQVVGQYYNFLRLGREGYTTGDGDAARHRHLALGRDREARSLRALLRRQRHPRVRVHGCARGCPTASTTCRALREEPAGAPQEPRALLLALRARLLGSVS